MSDYELNPDVELTLSEVTTVIGAFITGGQPTITQDIFDLIAALVPDLAELFVAVETNP